MILELERGRKFSDDSRVLICFGTIGPIVDSLGEEVVLRRLRMIMVLTCGT